MKIGAHYHNGTCAFTVWAPFRKEVCVKMLSASEETIPMRRDDMGYWHAAAEGRKAGALYVYVLDGIERPDPASFCQPEGVHGPSCVIDHNDFPWGSRPWQGIPLPEMIIYELHVGTFTEEGNFKGAIGRLNDLVDLGVNTIEIMPVAQFPGERNWGYDGVYPFAVQNSYGGPQGLKELVDACHARGLAVILDVVYNHLGPEGNYFHDFGPYFTDKYTTPWGKAVNFDDAYSDGVRNYFSENTLHWFKHYRIDALRLDAVHAIFDQSAQPFLQQLARQVEAFSKEQGRKFYLIAESDLNDTRVVRPRETGGFAIDAQWSDDFHHALHALLTGEDTGYYQDFGTVDDLNKAIANTFVYDGQYSKYRERIHGNSPDGLPGSKFVISLQNHDQVGNRMFGERLSSLVSFEGLKCAAGLLLLSPYIPLLFMGEEYAEENPFNYFISHSDEELVTAVRSGRSEELKSFKYKGNPLDPQAEDVFEKSKLNWGQRVQGRHKVMHDFYKQLIGLRKTSKALNDLSKHHLKTHCLRDEHVMILRRSHGKEQIMGFFNLGGTKQTFQADMDPGPWRKALDSSETKWEGPGSAMPEALEQKQECAIEPLSFVVYKKER